MVSGLVWKQYVDHQRETVLPTTDGLTREQTAPVLPPSTPTLSGLHNHPALVGTPDVHRDVARDSPPGRSPRPGVEAGWCDGVVRARGGGVAQRAGWRRS